MKKLPLPLKEAVRSSKKPPGKEVLEELLRRHFGHSHFRTKQLEAIQAALSGRDCFCLMPTGGGKSMCYQIPALAKVGIVLVISPLIALMENQVKTLKQKGISAEYLSSTQTPQVREKIHDELDCGKLSLRLLYVTPELVATPGFKVKLSKLHSRGLLSLIAIDEVHCISSWGHDFRPAYRKLSSLKNDLPDVPLLALTATAAPKVEKDVIESLGLRNPLILRASFNRPNIFYEVRYKDITDDTNTDLFNLIKSRGSVCSIIYCHERSTCDDLSAHLRKNGISCAAYHAGLNDKTRSNVLDDWISSRTQVVVATVAFGMGIDRKDVRLVCHYNIPKSMESFYQESGRAGRDNFSSESVLYYGLDDCRRMEFILRNAGAKRQKSSTVSDASVKKSLADFTQMVEYCEGSGCRRKKILECFGEQVSGSLCRKTCDACKDPCNVAASLRKLGHFSSNRQRCGLVPVFMNSSMDFPSVAHETEFWNREEEEDLSEESISVSDDEAEVVNIRIKPTMQGDSRMELLQRAEERYYANSCPKRKAAGLSEKKAISGTLREAAKQRMSNALKQAHERLGIPMAPESLHVILNSLADNFSAESDIHRERLVTEGTEEKASFIYSASVLDDKNLESPLAFFPRVDPEPPAALLELDCYDKYKKAGRAFYNSQVASTVRWLSSSSHEQIDVRLGALSPPVAVTKKSNDLPPKSSLMRSQSSSPAESAEPEGESSATWSSSEIRAPFPIESSSEFAAEKASAGPVRDPPAGSSAQRSRSGDRPSGSGKKDEGRGFLKGT